MAKKWRALTPEEAHQLGLEPAPQKAPRQLTVREASQLGLDKPPPQVGAWETFNNEAVDSIPLAGTVTDAATAALLQANGAGTPSAQLTPQARAEAQKLGIDVPPEVGIMDVYRNARDTRHIRELYGDEQNPGPAIAGKVFGTGVSMMAPLPTVRLPGSAAAGLPGALARIGSGALTGGAYAAENELEHGDADLTRGEFRRAGGNALKAGAAGTVLGGGLATAGEGVRLVVRQPLLKSAIEQGRRAIMGEATLKGATKLPISDESVGMALMKEGSREAPISALDTPEKIYAKLEERAAGQGEEYAALVKALEENGVEGPTAARIADDMLSRAAADELASGADKSVARRFLREGVNAENVSENGRIPLGRAEQIKRRLQDEARSEYRKANGSTPTGDAKKAVASVYRQAVEDAVDTAAKAAPPGSFAAEVGPFFGVLKRQLANTIEARDAAEIGASKAAQRSGMGLPEKIAMAGAAMSGSPTAALLAPAKAGIMSAISKRWPATSAAYSYALANALENGGAAGWLGRAAGQGYGELSDDEKLKIQAMIDHLKGH